MHKNDKQQQYIDWLDEHGSSVVKVARAYTLSEDDAQDLAQEILLQAWRSLQNFEGRSSISTWFYRVALNTAMNWHRREKPRRSFQKPLLEVHEVKADAEDCAERLQQRDTIEQLYRAIHHLSKTDAALVLLYLDEMSYREIADILGISENHVGVKLNRAKKSLSQLMKGESNAS